MVILLKSSKDCDNVLPWVVAGVGETLKIGRGHVTAALRSRGPLPLDFVPWLARQDHLAAPYDLLIHNEFIQIEAACKCIAGDRDLSLALVLDRVAGDFLSLQSHDANVGIGGLLGDIVPDDRVFMEGIGGILIEAI